MKAEDRWRPSDDRPKAYRGPCIGGPLKNKRLEHYARRYVIEQPENTLGVYVYDGAVWRWHV